MAALLKIDKKDREILYEVKRLTVVIYGFLFYHYCQKMMLSGILTDKVKNNWE